MRTTIDLPADLHRTAKALARDQGRSFSETVVLLLRRALGQGSDAEVQTRNAATGLPSIRLGTTVTSEDVRALDDEL
jgi:predicted transcriptional regulator